VKLTTARFYRPNGEAIHQVGVAPDMLLEVKEGAADSFGSADDAELHEAVDLLQSRERFARRARSEYARDGRTANLHATNAPSP
jgi:C-terminal processing protease CtpA/Prc